MSKTNAQEKIKEFFKEIRNKTPKEVKKIKRLAMNKKIPLKEERKLFCKKCLTPYYGKEKIRIKKRRKSVECGDCGFVARWELKS